MFHDCLAYIVRQHFKKKMYSFRFMDFFKYNTYIYHILTGFVHAVIPVTQKAEAEG